MSAVQDQGERETDLHVLYSAVHEFILANPAGSFLGNNRLFESGCRLVFQLDRSLNLVSETSSPVWHSNGATLPAIA